MEVEHGMPPKGSFPLQKGDVPLNHDPMGAITNQMLQVPLAISEPSQNCTPKSIKCELRIKRATVQLWEAMCEPKKVIPFASMCWLQNGNTKPAIKPA